MILSYFTVGMVQGCRRRKAPQNRRGTDVAVGSRTRWWERVKFGDALADA
jgi:hypothetical protein